MEELRSMVERAGWRSRRWPSSCSADRLFEGLLTVLAAAVVGLALVIVWELWQGAADARRAFGLRFVWSSTWDPVSHVFGALPHIYGTVATSLVALLLAGPLGVGTAIFLTELAPRRLRAPVTFLIEMLAAIPSVIYGLWALFVLAPIVRQDLEPWLRTTFSFLPLFSGPHYGVGLLAASLVLAIMFLPTVTAISRDVLATVPRTQREGLFALGATRWEVIRVIALPFARRGIAGALILALGRALGETMAVAMVIGNRGTITGSLFALGDTMPQSSPTISARPIPSSTRRP